MVRSVKVAIPANAVWVLDHQLRRYRMLLRCSNDAKRASEQTRGSVLSTQIIAFAYYVEALEKKLSGKKLLDAATLAKLEKIVAAQERKLNHV